MEERILTKELGVLSTRRFDVGEGGVRLLDDRLPEGLIQGQSLH